MDIKLTFTLADIGWFVIWGLVSVLLIYVIMILAKFYTSLRAVNKIVLENRENIDKVLDEAPGITKNINDISTEIAHGTQAFRGTVDNIAGTTESVTEVVKENNSVVDSLASAFHTINMVKNLATKFTGSDEDHNSTNDGN